MQYSRKRARWLALPLLMAAFGCEYTNPADGPVVEFTWAAASFNPLQITFDGSPSTSNVGALSYRWNYGDGSQSDCSETGTGNQCSEVKPTHTYMAKRHYQVTLTVADGNQTLNRVVHDVLAGNKRPTAVLTAAAAALVGEAIFFDGSSSVDPDGQVVRWVFDFGDATPVVDSQAVSKTSHAYSAIGTYTAKLRVYDNDGEVSLDPVASATVRVVQNQTPPTVGVTSPLEGDVVRGTITLKATVTGAFPLTSVEFYVDQLLVASVTLPPGAPSSAAPSIPWDSTTVSDGPHVLTARAYNSANGVGVSAPVRFVVQNHATQ